MAMQELPQALPFTQWGALLVDEGFIDDMVEGAAAAAGHLMNLCVAGSLQLFASATPAPIAKITAIMRIRFIPVPPLVGRETDADPVRWEGRLRVC